MSGGVLSVRVVVHRRAKGGTFVLDVALTAAPGVTVVLGPSGAGKTTLLAAIAGLVRPDEGRIELDGDVWFDRAGRVERPTHDRPLAMVLQTAALFPHLSVRANVEYGLARSVPRRARRARALSLLELMSAASLAERRPASLSGGEAQRVAVARALARAPRLLLLDEPFAALDRDLRRTLGAEVKARIAAIGIPALFVTHDREEAHLVGDRALRLERGAVLATGPVADVVETTN